MQAIGVAEDNIFKKRKEDDVRLRRISSFQQGKYCSIDYVLLWLNSGLGDFPYDLH